MEKHTAYISVGSNIGDKLLNCKKGIEALTDPGVVEIIAWSHFYKTSPVDYKDQDWFINAVVKVETALKPDDLLKKMVSVQYNAGRIEDKVRFGPRVLDLDIILYDDLVIDSPKLTIPHPRMHKRLFVLKPLCDIDSSVIHPVFKKDIKYLLDNLDDNEQQIIKY
ncbi:2-amino-4-hydroxy-6-hydroxymethyldihydropteridine diphosphokinase [Desulfobacterium sp. N47]|uniref:2-amino-4-hydroxy-6- hydroxymethyldihydropteridine diphosphokinase n=1 Tax=Desulfobacterium sp. N47 TaxID=3115210 RepID=UPI003F49E022